MSGWPGTALIVGASRGLGLGLAQRYLQAGHRVIATVRGEPPPALAEAAAEAGSSLEIERLDINDTAGIGGLAGTLAGRSLDLLFVNAGIIHPPEQQIGGMETEEFVRILVTNALSPLRVIEALHHLVPAGGVIAAMSSGLGSVSGNETGGYEGYRASKAALNTLLRSFASRAGAGRAVLAVDPGWVRTDMGGENATLDVDTSTAGIVRTLEAERGKDGVRFVNYQGRTVAW